MTYKQALAKKNREELKGNGPFAIISKGLKDYILDEFKPGSVSYVILASFDALERLQQNA